MQPCEMLRLRMMLCRQAVVRNLPNTYSNQERRQLMSSPIGFHLFDGQNLAAVEQRGLESLQWSLISQITHGLASTAQGVRTKTGRAVGSRHLALFRPLLLPRRVVPFAIQDSSLATLVAVGDLAIDAAEVPLQVGACLQRRWQEWENIRACEWVIKTLQYGYVLPFLKDPPLLSTPVEFPVYRKGSDHHLALEAVVLDTVRAPSLPVTRSGQPFSGSCPTSSASQGSTSVPLQVFAGTSCISRMVSARWDPADMGSAVVPKEALQSFQQTLSGSLVSVMSDNLTVVAYLRKSGGTRSEPLSALAGMVLQWCESHSISLCPAFVPGHSNVIADVLSWEYVGSEWNLHPKICRKVFKVWGSPLVDVCQGTDSSSAPVCNSSSGSGNLATGCILFSVGQSRSVRLSGEGSHMTIVTPLWPQADWFHLLLDLLMDSPWVLPMWQSLLRQPHCPLFHGSPEKLHLYAWRLSNRSRPFFSVLFLCGLLSILFPSVTLSLKGRKLCLLGLGWRWLFVVFSQTKHTFSSSVNF
ncbi:hypothetical protein E2C01_044862 [Portunus trituberculatus]|uniref:Uncharacterized protein n=1 Tax=Portunus trituberculatus TaxID=210409 RepID=A0A5B7G3H0_PORTR|nr:hypothetical protein [Portunus trituberculatus]